MCEQARARTQRVPAPGAQVRAIAGQALVDAAAGGGVAVGIEGSAAWTEVVQDVRRDAAASGLSFWPVKVVMDKVSRAGGWASLAHGGRVHLVEGPWVTAFRDEVEGFPQEGLHDDQVGAVSGAHEMLQRHGAMVAEAGGVSGCGFRVLGWPRVGPGPVFRVPHGGF